MSETFRSIELVAARDSLGRSIERRWSNLQVLFEGDTVDSWRVSEERIAFRVPPSYSGGYTIDIRPRSFGIPTLQAQVIGARPGYGPLWACGNLVLRELVSVSAEELLAYMNCVEGFGPLAREGIVRLTPGNTYTPVSLLPISNTDFSDVWIDDLWYVYRGEDLQLRTDVQRGTWAPGPSYRPGYAVVERFARTAGDSSSTWLWRFGADPAPEMPIECLPPDYGWGQSYAYTAAELAPGVCLALTREGEVYLDGSDKLLDLQLRSYSWPSFRLGPDGTAVLRNATTYPDREWPVFKPELGLAYTIEEYSEVRDVAFAPSGDSMYVTGFTGEQQSSGLVLDLRDVDSGALLARSELGCDGSWNVAAVARDDEHLWIARFETVDGNCQFRVELRDPADLSVQRAVAVPELDGVSRGGVLPVEPNAILLPDEASRGAYIISEWADYVHGFSMELY